VSVAINRRYIAGRKSGRSNVARKGRATFHESKPDGAVMGERSDAATHMVNMSMGMLAARLTEGSNRTLLDKTGLAGRYENVTLQAQRRYPK
jgi:uncharacterized protein (TIGR03435 family)